MATALRPPTRVRDALTAVRNRPAMRAGIDAMQERAPEFETPMAATLAGVAIHPPARKHFDAELDKMWADARMPKKAGEVVVGAGLHAAVYCAVRAAQGHEKPLVIEMSERVGGAFAVSGEPTFYLNSRNRPGGLGIPGRGEALNVLPGAPLQPSDLNGDEYQRNSDLAFVIRTTLAMHARVVTGRRVISFTKGQVVLDGGDLIPAQRVIFATGIGNEGKPEAHDGKRIMTFGEFMARMDGSAFPLRGMKRVAVVGAGDSGRSVIEALTGQGPTTRWSVPSLDWIDKIDWYGVSDDQRTRGGWEACNRSRYKGIGRLLPSSPGLVGSRVTPLRERAENTAVGYGAAYVNGRAYDYVVWCGGFDDEPSRSSGEKYMLGGRQVARLTPMQDEWVVGPAACIPLSKGESAAGLSSVPENETALFRYADRTAALAAALPALVPSAPPKPSRPKKKRVRRQPRPPGFYEDRIKPMYYEEYEERFGGPYVR